MKNLLAIVGGFALFASANCAFAQQKPSWGEPVYNAPTYNAPKYTAPTPKPKPIAKPVAKPSFTPNYSNTTPSAPVLTSKIAPATYTNIDESQQLLDFDKAFSQKLAEYGPLYAYSSAISDYGVLYDAGSASPTGSKAAESRFSGFPATMTLVRNPESAVSYGGAGSSWGTYEVQKDGETLSQGRYICVWRKENGQWKIIAELDAGVDAGPPRLPTPPNSPNVQNKKPPNLGLLRPNGTMTDALGRVVVQE
jgi:Domain of unknown function (DUF4440)